MRIKPDDLSPNKPHLQIKVIGVGGGGCNAVKQMNDIPVDGVELIAANTDIAVLNNNTVAHKLQIGTKTCRGNGAGTDPEIGRKAAEEDTDAIRAVLEGADMVFIAAGMGGGTGTGAAPIIAGIARDMGIPSLAIVTKPFMFEGGKRMAAAEHGIIELQEQVDSLIVIPNERISSMEDDLPMLEAFKKVDEVLKDGVINLVEIIQNTGMINIDLKDIQMVMAERGFALLAAGEAEGQNRAEVATQSAMWSPLIEHGDLSKARGLLMCVIASPSLTNRELKIVGDLINEVIDPDINVKFGWIIDENMGEKLKVVMLATGISSTAEVGGWSQGGGADIGWDSNNSGGANVGMDVFGLSTETPSHATAPQAPLQQKGSGLFGKLINQVK
ncbi:MAG: cell division protein FtsZ [Cardiobacteriaceae bacterium]|nr:cell division protein FtsZ [Cardiobacteriaceae bacterium]